MYNMFNIYSIYAGWMTVSFGERKDEGYSYTDKNGEVFHFSYLDDVKEQLDNLFNLDYSDVKNKKDEEFDLEGEDVWIHTALWGDKIHIFCSYMYVDEPRDFHYIFDYKDFLKEYVETMKEYKEQYLKDFSYHESYYNWDNRNWEEIIEKIK